jgi:hypothetical protein
MEIHRTNTARAGASDVRELDRRTSNGIDVRLLWQPQRNRVSVVVTDRRVDGSFDFEVDPADALEAFHHPYVYASRDGVAHAFAA